MSPKDYWTNFAIEKETGLITVVKELNRENTLTLKVLVMVREITV